MGLEKDVAQSRVFLSISFGKVRQKRLENGNSVDEHTPGAVKRLTQSGKPSWAVEYRAISGMITGVYYKTNDNYKNSYEVLVKDGPDLFQVSFKEGTVFLRDFMEKFPNIDLKSEVQISPYDFEKDGKRRVGVSIKQDNDSIRSFYKEYNEDKNTITSINGFPSSDGVDFKVESQRKIFNIKVDDFLKNEFLALITSKFKNSQVPDENNYAAPMPTASDEPDLSDVDDDLPF